MSNKPPEYAVFSLTELSPDEAAQLLIVLGCREDLFARVSTLAVKLDGRYLSNINGVDILQDLENDTSALRRPILTLVLQQLVTMQKEGVPHELLQVIRDALKKRQPPPQNNAPFTPVSETNMTNQGDTGQASADPVEQIDDSPTVIVELPEQNMHTIHVPREPIQQSPVTTTVELLHAAKLQGHRALVSALLISKTLLFSASHDNTIKVWDIDTNTCIGSMSGHSNWISCLAISTRRHKLYSGSWDNTIKEWDLNTLECVHTFNGHVKEVRALFVDDSTDRLYSASYDHTIKAWDLNTYLCSQTFAGHEKPVLCLVFSSILNKLYSGSEDTTIKVWDLGSHLYRCISTMKGHSKSVSCLVLSADGGHLYSGSQDNTIKIWDILAQSCIIATLTGHSNWVRCLVYCFKTHRLISGSADNTIKVWDMTTKKCIHTAKGQNKWILSLALTEDSNFLYSGSGSETPSCDGNLIEGWYVVEC
jgi:WD40 repeat protein